MIGYLPVMLASLPQFSDCCDSDLQHAWDPAGDRLHCWVECARCGRVYWSQLAALALASSS